MSVYALFLVGSTFFAPVISGFINDDMGWQWVFVSLAHLVSASVQCLQLRFMD